MFSLYALPLFLTSLCVSSFGVFVLIQKPRARANLLFSLMSLAVAWWAAGYGMMYCMTSAESGLRWARFGYLGVCLIPVFFYHFVREFLRLSIHWKVYLLYGLALLFWPLTQTSYFLDGMYTYFWGFYPKAGSWYWTFLIFFYGTFLVSLFEIISRYRFFKSNPQPEPTLQQMRYVLLAYFVVATLSISDYLPNYGLKVYPSAYLAATGWLGIMAYACFRHRLLSINLVVRRTLVYSILVSLLSALYLGMLYLGTRTLESLIGITSAGTSLLAMLLVVLIAHPLRLKVQAFIDGLFLREKIQALPNRIRDEVLALYSGQLTHELKSPLAHILTPTELTLMELQDIKAGKKTFEQALPKLQDRLRYVISQVLEANRRFEAVRQLSSDKEEGQRIAPKDLIDAVMAQVNELGNRNAVSISTSFQDGVPPILGQMKQLELVFINLIKNAIEAKAKEISLQVSFKGAEVLFQVQDDGEGLEPDYLQKVFEPYFSTKGSSGTGIGLYLSRIVIERHRGRILVNSVPGKGTEFSLYFPRAN